MDGLVVLAIIYFAISMIVKGKKNQGAQQRGEAPQRSTGGAPTNAPAKAAKQAASAQKKKEQPKPAYQPMKPSTSIGEGESHMHHSLQMRMDSIADSRPKRQEYMGSMGVGSMEGMDTCDKSLGHRDADDSFYAQGSVYEESIGEAAPKWSANAIVQGVIMSEILKRPSERKWGRA